MFLNIQLFTVNVSNDICYNIIYHLKKKYAFKMKIYISLQHPNNLRTFYLKPLSPRRSK